MSDYPPKVITEYFPPVIDYKKVVNELVLVSMKYGTRPTPERLRAIDQLSKLLIDRLEELQ